MTNSKDYIGTNIKEVRKQRGISQEKLSVLCGISNTLLSAYENNRKKPGIDILAKIAKNLEVSIERLYYGDENSSFIESETDEGKKIVSSLYFLWTREVIDYQKVKSLEYSMYSIPTDHMVVVSRFQQATARLVTSLRDFQLLKNTYDDPEAYLKVLFSSVATEINKLIEREKEELRQGQLLD